MATKTKERPYAAYTPAELVPVIAKANAATCKKIREAVLAAHWSPEGNTIKRIENREAELAGKEPPHVIRRRTDLPPAVGTVKGA